MSTDIQRTELTPELMQAFGEIISRGNYYITACRALKISFFVFNRWRQIGADADSGIYRQFYDLINQADAAAEIYAVNSWRNQFGKDYHAEKDFLSRRYPDRWGERKQIIVAVEREIEDMLRHLQKRLPPETFESVINEIAEINREHELEIIESFDDA